MGKPRSQERGFCHLYRISLALRRLPQSAKCVSSSADRPGRIEVAYPAITNSRWLFLFHCRDREDEFRRNLGHGSIRKFISSLSAYGSTYLKNADTTEWFASEHIDQFSIVPQPRQTAAVPLNPDSVQNCNPTVWLER
jgi:hypothetical protein